MKTYSLANKQTFKQKGIALISTMIVVGIATALVTSILIGQTIELTLAERSNIRRQVILYHLSVEELAKSLMSQYEESYNAPGGSWSQTIYAPVDNFIIEAQLFDLQTKVNINNLYNYNPRRSQNGRDNENNTTLKIQKFTNDYLVDILDNERMNIPSQSLVYILVDWMDSNNDTITFEGYSGAESEAYIYREPPYKTSNRRLTSIDELALVHNYEITNSIGVSPMTLFASKTVSLPTEKYTTINVNMLLCSSDIWLTLLEADTSVINSVCVNESDSENELFEEEQQFYETVEDFFAQLKTAKNYPFPDDVSTSWEDLLSGLITTKSSFFLLNADYQYEDCSFIIQSILELSEGQQSAVTANIRHRWIQDLSCLSYN